MYIFDRFSAFRVVLCVSRESHSVRSCNFLPVYLPTLSWHNKAVEWQMRRTRKIWRSKPSSKPVQFWFSWPSLDGFGDERDVFEVVLRSGFTILTVVLRLPDCSLACGSLSVPFACISMVKCERWFEWRYAISGRIVVDTTKQWCADRCAEREESDAASEACLVLVFSAFFRQIWRRKDVFVWCSVPVTVLKPFSFGFTTPKTRFRDNVGAVLRHPDCSFACQIVSVSFAWIPMVKSED